MSWKSYDGSIKGTRVEGDSSVPSTYGDLQHSWLRLLRHLWLFLFVWKAVAVFHVSYEDVRKGYRIGFVPLTGDAKIMKKLVHDRGFRVRRGGEDCTFFAVDPDGREIELELVILTDKKDPRYQFNPLY